jgi:glycosyltransferase involved in cell wall biosynthesis
MKIIIVSAMFPPARTGTSFYTQNLAAKLTADGHEVSVVTVENDDASSESYSYKVYNLSALHVPLPGFFKHFRVCAFSPKNYSLLKKMVKESEADVILLVNHYLDIVFPAIYAARANSIPLVCSVGTQLQSSKKFRDRMLNFFDRLICGNFVFPFCDKVVAWDTQILKYLSDIQGKRVTDKTVIVNYAPNGNVEEFLIHDHNYKMHDQILGVGAVTEQRDFLPLVHAFISLAPRFPNLKLKIIGHIYNDAAVNLIHEHGLDKRVEFTGEQTHEVVLEEMKVSDLFFASLSGKYVGMGTATIEAMMLGIPVVVNAPIDLLGKVTLMDMGDFVSSNGLTCEQIAERMSKLLHQEELRSTIGQNGRKFVSNHMNWNVVSKDMTQVLSDAKDEY